MRNLVKAELYKLIKSSGYRVMMALSVGVGGFFVYFWVANSNRASGYQMLPVMDSFVMFHTIFTGAFTAVFLCSEFSGRTMGMGFFCGRTRRSVFLSKLVVYFRVAVSVVRSSGSTGFDYDHLKRIWTGVDD